MYSAVAVWLIKVCAKFLTVIISKKEEAFRSGQDTLSFTCTHEVAVRSSCSRELTDLLACTKQVTPATIHLHRMISLTLGSLFGFLNGPQRECFVRSKSTYWCVTK